MTLERLLDDYLQALNDDGAYNLTILDKEDRCAARAKYLYGNRMHYLICNMIRQENDIQSIKIFISIRLDNFRFDFQIVTLIFAKYLAMNFSDVNAYNDFSNYILKYHIRLKEKAEQIKSLVAERRFDSALEIVKAMSN
jgi:hypothetical protein